MKKAVLLIIVPLLVLAGCSISEVINGDSGNADKIFVINNAGFGIHSDKTNARATTDGINRAIETAREEGYNVIKFAPGDYLIACDNPTYDNPRDGIFLCSKMTFDLGTARFFAEPTDNPNTAVFQLERVEYVNITGGEVTGNMVIEAGQYGVAFNMLACEHVLIRDVKIKSVSSCGIRLSSFGDYYVRQTLFNEHVRVTGCEFEDCGWEGINIAHGVHIEIDSNRFVNFPVDRPGNHAWGMSAIRVLRYGTDRRLQYINIHHNEFDRCNAAIIVSSSEDVEISDNLLKETKMIGIGVTDSHRVKVYRNTLETPDARVNIAHNIQDEYNEDICVPTSGANKNDGKVVWDATTRQSANFKCE
jgi:hypothetical protein